MNSRWPVLNYTTLGNNTSLAKQLSSIGLLINSILWTSGSLLHMVSARGF